MRGKQSPARESLYGEKTDHSTTPSLPSDDHKPLPIHKWMCPSLGREWEIGVEEECLGTLDPSVTKIPELIGSLETTRGSASKCDLPSCRSDISGDSIEDKDETCKGAQEHAKTPEALSPAEGEEQRHELGLTMLELHE